MRQRWGFWAAVVSHEGGSGLRVPGSVFCRSGNWGIRGLGREHICQCSVSSSLGRPCPSGGGGPRCLALTVVHLVWCQPRARHRLLTCLFAVYLARRWSCLAKVENFASRSAMDGRQGGWCSLLVIQYSMLVASDTVGGRHPLRRALLAFGVQVHGGCGLCGVVPSSALTRSYFTTYRPFKAQYVGPCGK